MLEWSDPARRHFPVHQAHQIYLVSLFKNAQGTVYPFFRLLFQIKMLVDRDI